MGKGVQSRAGRWWIVAVAAFGLSTSPGQFAYGAFSLFIEPLEQEFGWARADMSLALTLFTLCLAVTLPFIGRLVDRYGSRRVLAPSMLVLGVGLCVLGWRLDALWILLTVYVLIGVLGAGANSPPYMRTVSSWFDR
ncbi:MAG: MFS transporter, partial [Chromatiales bacterium]|nr:MFS transporter [Chromatiales bacterium]